MTRSLRFSVLGPIEVHDGDLGSPVPQRARCGRADRRGDRLYRTPPEHGRCLGGAAAPATVTVAVKHRLGLKVKLVGRKATFTGTIGPKHNGRAVTIQRKAGGKWRKVATVKTNRKAAFGYLKRFAKARPQRPCLHPEGRRPPGWAQPSAPGARALRRHAGVLRAAWALGGK